MSAPVKQSLSQAHVDLFGSNGVLVRNSVTAAVGDWFVIECMTDTVFAAITENGLATGSDSIVGVTFPAGTRIVNAQGITAFTLTSGVVRAYNR